jgi:hypothetical protein
MLRLGMLAYVLVHGWYSIPNTWQKTKPTHPV